MEANSSAETLTAKTITTIRLETNLARIIPVGENFQDESPVRTNLTKIKYTLRPGDDKRLDKRGVLKVYNINTLIEIPVTGLLGQWKNTHVGTTIFKADDKWQIEGSDIKPILIYKKASASIVKRLIFKYKSINFLERVFSKRIAQENVFKNA